MIIMENDIINIKTELILCDKHNRCYFESDLSLVKFMRGTNGKVPQPYEIPLNCLISMFGYPELQMPWTMNSLEKYSELYKIGFNFYKLNNNKAKLSSEFPGLTLQTSILYNFQNFIGKSRFKQSIDIGTSHWPRKGKIFWLPTIANYLKDHECKNEKCGYTSDRKNNMSQHEEICTSESLVFAQELIRILF